MYPIKEKKKVWNERERIRLEDRGSMWGSDLPAAMRYTQDVVRSKR